MFVTYKSISFFPFFWVYILIMRKSVSGARWNIMIDIFVDNFVVIDDDDNVYVGFYGVYGLVNG